MSKKYVKMFFFNFLLVVVNVLFFSKGFIGASIHHENVVIAGLSIALPIIDIILLVYINYSLLNQKNKIEYDINEIIDVEDYKKAVMQAKKRLKFLSFQLDEMLSQIEEIERKKGALLEYLRQNNQVNGVFVEEAVNTEQYILKNIKKILNKCILIEPSTSMEVANKEYKEQMEYITNTIKKNEETLEKFQDFLYEVSLYGEKETPEDISLQSTIQVLRQLRGEEVKDFHKTEKETKS